jgi:uncharacterized protein (TIGR00369 family)
MTVPGVPRTIADFQGAGDDGLPGHLGMRVAEVGEGRVVIEQPVARTLFNPNGQLHGGAIVALADTAMGHACIAHLPDGARGFTTIELKSNFLATATDGTLVSTATPVHLGRTTQVWDADVVHRESGRRLALVRATQLLVR